MFFSDLHSSELGLIQSLQLIRTPWVDTVFLTVNIFDNVLTYLVIVYLVYALKSAREGIHLLWILTIGTITYLDLKDLFSQPRPYQLLPELKILGATGYGFPSGAALSSVLLFGFIFFLTPNWNWKWKSFAVFMLLMVGLARVYLGAHFPSDVLGGYLLGIFLLVLYKYLMSLLEKWTANLSNISLFFLCLVVLLVFLLVHAKEYSAAFCSLLMGAVSSYLFFKKKKSSESFFRRGAFLSNFLKITSLIFGVLGVMILFHFSKIVSYPPLVLAIYFFTGAWFQIGGMLFKAILPKKWKILI